MRVSTPKSRKGPTNTFSREPSLYLVVIAGFFTGGALAIRGGYKAARNGAITCGCLLAVIEGVGIGFQRMMADNQNMRIEVSDFSSASRLHMLINYPQMPPPPSSGGAQPIPA